jgi:hypothetical protein
VKQIKINDSDKLSTENFYDINTTIVQLDKVIQEYTGIVVGNPSVFYPRLLTYLGFRKRTKRTYDAQGVRRNTSEWNFPIPKLLSYSNPDAAPL